MGEIQTLSQKWQHTEMICKKDVCTTCSLPQAKIGAIVLDEYGKEYLYPIKEAKFCPECGKSLNKESINGESAS